MGKWGLEKPSDLHSVTWEVCGRAVTSSADPGKCPRRWATCFSACIPDETCWVRQGEAEEGWELQQFEAVMWRSFFGRWGLGAGGVIPVVKTLLQKFPLSVCEGTDAGALVPVRTKVMLWAALPTPVPQHSDTWSTLYFCSLMKHQPDEQKGITGFPQHTYFPALPESFSHPSAL